MFNAFNLFKRWWKRSDKQVNKQIHRRRQPRPLYLETLEDRNLLTTFTVPLQSLGSTDVTLRLDTSLIEVLDTSSGTLLAQQDTTNANITAIAVQGSAGVNDTLRIDYSGGLFNMPISFTAGLGGSDSLFISGANFQSGHYQPTGTSSGAITLDQQTITYTGTSSITDTDVVANTAFDLSSLAGNQQAEINDTGNGAFAIDGNGTGALSSFTLDYPTATLQITGAAPLATPGPNPTSTTIDLDSLAPTFTAPVTIQSGGEQVVLVVKDGVTAAVSFDGDNGANTVVNPQGDPNLITSRCPIEVDRPLLFIPGFGGTGPNFSEPNGYQTWLTTRGLDPSQLSLEPYSNTYSNFVQSITNLGYVQGSTYFTVLWDWRLPVAVNPGDTTDDGVLSAITPSFLVGEGFDSGVGYLEYYLKQATASWDALTGATSTDVDIVTHSTGGLVARAYLQSLAYQDTSDPADIPRVHNLVQVGVPDIGAPTFNFLEDNFNVNTASRLLASAMDQAYNQVLAGGTIIGPDYNITSDWLQAQATADNTTPEAVFISAYVSTFQNLLGTYPDIQADADLVGGNALLSDMDADGWATNFVANTFHTTIVYSDETTTTVDTFTAQTGFQPSAGLSNLLLPFTDLLGTLPSSDQTWYSPDTAPGDGTVPYESSAEPFLDISTALMSKVTLVEAEQASRSQAPVLHTDLVNNAGTQQVILQALTGVANIPSGDISTGLLRSTAESGAFLVTEGVINPIDYVNAALDKVHDVIGDIQTLVSPALNQQLPLVNKSIEDYLTDPNDGIAYDLFAKFNNAVGDIPNSVSLLTAEQDIDTELGLTPAEFNITLNGGVLALNFDIDLNGSKNFNLDLSSVGPMSGMIPLPLSVDLQTQFSLQVDLGAMLADPEQGPGTNAVSVQVDQFQLGATLNAPGDINTTVGVNGLGSFTVTGGTATISGAISLAPNSFSLAQILTTPANTLGSLLSFTPQLSASFNLPVTAQAGAGPLSIFGSGTLQFSDPNVLVDATPDISLQINSGRISIADFAYIAGSFAFQIGQDETATLSDSSTKQVAVTEVGATNVNIFVGTGGPYFVDSNGDGVIDGNDAPAASGAIGFTISDADFALALLTPTDTSDDSLYYALSASGYVQSVGLPAGVSVAVNNFSVQINGSANDSGHVVNFATSFPANAPNPAGLEVQTGGTPIFLDYAESLVQVDADATLTIDNQSLSGHVDFTDSNGQLNVAVSNFGMTLQAGSTQILQLDNGNGSFDITPSGVDFQVGFDLAVNGGPALPGVTLDPASYQLDVDTIAPADYVRIEVDGLNNNNPAGLTVLDSKLTANSFVFEKDGNDVDFSATNFDLTLAAGATQILSLSGNAALEFSSAGVAADFTLSGTGPTLAGLSLSLPTVDLEINTTGQEVDTIEGQTVDLPGGASYVNVVATGADLKFSGLDLSVGQFTFTQSGQEVSADADSVTLTIGSTMTLTGSADFHFDANDFTLDSATLSISQLSLGSFISLTDPTLALTGLTWTAGGNSGALTGSVAVTVGSATLFPGDSAISATISANQGDTNGLTGTFDLSDDAFSLTVDHFDLSIANVFTATADGFNFDYNPNGGNTQTIATIGNGMISLPLLSLSGMLSGVTIFENGFTIDGLTVQEDSVQVSTFFTASNLAATFTDFSYTYGQPVDFGGTIGVSADSATVNLGSMTASVTAPSGSTAPGLSATIQFSNNAFQSLNLQGQLATFQIGSYVDVTATSITLDTGAGPNDVYASVTDLSASIDNGLLSATSTGTISVTGGGILGTSQDFGFNIAFGTGTAGTLKLPSWLPISIQQFGINWTNFNTDPTNFTVTLSASVNGSLFGVSGLNVSGSITGLQIDFGDLLNGKDPIVGLGSATVSVSGDLFDGTITGELIFGLAPFDNDGNLVPEGSNTPVANTVFFGGLQGGFSMGGVGGFTISVGLSSLGPLGVEVSASLPDGVLLEPTTGLSINDFVGGVEFFHELPSVTSADDLADSDFQFSMGTPPDQADWLTTLEGQVVTQYDELQSNPGMSGFTAAFTSPMTIVGKGTVFSAYVSQQVFNGTLTVELSTPDVSQGETGPKIFVGGTLNFADNHIQANADLYADLSHVNTGSATVLFLSQTPVQLTPPLLTMKGVLTLGFVDQAGNPVTTPTPDIQPPTLSDTSPTADLADPVVNGGVIQVDQINQGSSPYLDIQYHATPASGMPEDSILGNGPQFTLSGPGAADITGIGQPIDEGGGVFRYPLTGQFDAGQVNVNFIPGSFSSNGNTPNQSQATESFTVFAPAYAFQIHLGSPQGAPEGPASAIMELQAPSQLGLNAPIMYISGQATLTFVLDQPQFDISVQGSMSLYYIGTVASAAGYLVLDFGGAGSGGGSGFFGADTPELYGVLAIDVNTDKLQQYGLNMNGSEVFEINTTDITQPITVTLQGVPGDTLFSVTDSSGMTGQLDGGTLPSSIAAAFASNGIQLPSGTGDSAVIPGQEWKVVDTANGNAEYFIETNSDGSLDIHGETQTFNLAPTTFSVSMAGELTIQPPGQSGADLTIIGSFYLSISAEGLTLDADGQVDVGPLGSLNVDGSMQITSAGIVAALDISNSDSLPGTGLDFSGFFELQINTTNDPANVQGLNVDTDTGEILGKTSVQLPRQSADLVIGGTLELADNLSLNGEFTLGIGSSTISVGIDASFDLFGASIHLDNSMTINAGGSLVYDGAISVPKLELPGDLMSFQGSFELSINTGSGQATASDGVSVPGSTAEVIITNATVGLFDDTLTASGSLTIGIVNGGFEIDIPQSSPLQLSFFGLVTDSMWGNYNSDGAFSFTSSVNVSFGDDILGAALSLTASLSNSGFAASGSATGDIAGISFNIANASLDVNNGDVTFTASVGSLSHTWTIGSVDQPVAPTLATVLGNGTLQLNVGVDASGRGGPYSNDTSENYLVTDDGAGNLVVSGFGYTQTYYGADAILASNTGIGNDTIDVQDFYPANLTAGSGNDQLLYQGIGTAILNAGSGNDVLTGGTGTTTFNSGPGVDTVNAGTGTNIVNASTGYLTVNGHSGAGTTVNWSDGDGILDFVGGSSGDTLFVNDPTPGDAVTLSQSNGQLQVAIGAETLSLSNVASLTLNLTGGGDNLTIDDLTGISTNISVNLNSGHTQADQIVFDGSASSNTYSLSTAASALTVAESGGATVVLHNLSLSAGDSVAVHGNSGNDSINASGVTTQLANLSLYADDGNDTLTGGPSPMSLYAGAGTDTLTSGGPNSLFGGTGADTLIAVYGTLLVHGGTGTNTLIFDDSTGQGLTATLTDTAVSAKRNGVTKVTPYNNIQTREVELGGGTNTLTVNGQFSGATSIIAGNVGGTDTIDIQKIGGATTVTTNGDAFTVNVANQNHLLQGINAALSVIGADSATAKLDVDVTGLPASTVTVNDASVTVLQGATSDLGAAGSIGWTALNQVEVDLGGGGDQATVNLAQPEAANYLINGGAGNDAFTVNATGTATDPSVTFDGNGGNDSFNANASQNAELQLSATDGPGSDTFNVTTYDTSSITGTLTGGTGGNVTNVANINLASPASTSLTASGVQLVNVTSTASAAWVLDQDKLNVGTQTVLNAGNAVQSYQLTGATIGSVDQPTTVTTSGSVTVGGVQHTMTTWSTLSNVTATLQLMGAGSLDLDDTHFTGSTQSEQLAAGVVSIGSSTGQIDYQGFTNLEVDLSAAANTMTVNGGSTMTTMNTGDGDDQVTVYQIAAPLNITLGGNAGDTVMAYGVSAELSITGGQNGAKVVVDRTADTSGLTGAIESDDGNQTLSVDGLGFGAGSIDLVSGIKELDVNLGSGNNRFTINAPSIAALSGLTVELDTGAGNNALDVVQDGVQTTVNGGVGSDTVTVEVPGSPALTSFNDLTIGQGISTLVINNSGYTGNVNWAADPDADEVEYGNDVPFISPGSAGSTHILGGTGADSLTVQSDSSGGDTATVGGVQVEQTTGPTVAGSQVELIDGEQVLQMATTGNNNTPVQTGALSQSGTIAGLNGATDIAVTTDGQFIYVAGKYDDSVTVFQRAADGSQLEYVQTITDAADPNAYHGNAATSDWDNVISNSDPTHWYQFNDSQKYNPAIQSIEVGSELYVLSAAANLLSVYGQDNSTPPEYTNLLWSYSVQDPVSFAVNSTGTVLYVVTDTTSTFSPLYSYTRDTNTGELTQEGSVPISSGATAVVADGPSTLYVQYTFDTQSEFTHQSSSPYFNFVTAAVLDFSASGSIPAMNPTTTVATAVGGGDVFYGTDAGLEIWHSGSPIAAFPLTGIRDVAVDDSFGSFSVAAVSMPNQINFYADNSGTWQLLTSDTDYDPQQLAWAAEPLGDMLYATSPEGGIVAYSVSVDDAGLSVSSEPGAGLPASTFNYGQPTSLFFTTSDRKHLYAVTPNDAVIDVINIDNDNSENALTLNSVLSNQAKDSVLTNKLPGTYVEGVSNGASGVIDGTANFNGSNGSIQLGGSDVTTAWTAEFIVDMLGTPSTSVGSSYLLNSSAGALKLDQYPNTGQVGYTDYGVGDYTFNLDDSTIMGRYVDLTFVGVPGTGVTLYYNGEPVGTDPEFIPLPMGSIGEGTEFSPDANIDELVIYNQALTPAQILAHVETASGSQLIDPVAIAVSPDNSDVYVAEGGLSGTIQVYSRDPNSGQLTYKQATQTGLQFASDTLLAFSNDGTSLYVAGHTGLIWEQRNTNTGELTYEGAYTSAPAADVVVSPATSVFANQYVAVSEPSADDVQVFQRNNDGSLSFLSDFPGGNGEQPGAMAYSPDGKQLYIISQSTGDLLECNVDINGAPEGVIQICSDSTFGNAIPTSLTISPDGQYLYVVDGGNTNTYVFSIASNGSLSSGSAQAGLQGAQSVVISPDGATLYEAQYANSSTGTLVAYNRSTSDGSLASAQTFDDGTDDETVNLSGLQSIVATPDGNFLVAIAPQQDALVLLGNDMTQKQILLNGYDGDLGLQGATDVAISPNGQYVFVASPVENTVAVFSLDEADSQLTLVNLYAYHNSQSTIINGPRSLVVSTDGTTLYVGGQSAFESLNIDSGGQLTERSQWNTPLGTVASMLAFHVSNDDYIVATDSSNNKLYLLKQEAGDLIPEQVFTDGVNGITGLAGAGDIALYFDSSTATYYVYVAATTDNTVAAFKFTNGQLTEDGIYTDGDFGVHGLLGVSAVSILSNANGHYLVAAGTAGNTLAVFQVLAGGQLQYVQTLHEGINGSVGLVEPNSLAVAPDASAIYVASSAGLGAATGGAAMYNNLAATMPVSGPAPAIYLASKIDNLTLSTGSGDDTISVLSAPNLAGPSSSPTFTIDAGDGANAVTLNALPGLAIQGSGTRAVTTTVNLGNVAANNQFTPATVANEVFIDSSVNHTGLVVNGGNGGDTYDLQQLGTQSALTINGGTGSDNFNVALDALGLGDEITLHGNQPTTGPGDQVLFNPGSDFAYSEANGHNPPKQNSDTVYATATATGTTAAAGKVAYDGMESAQVIAPPVITASGPYSVAEGSTLTLSATVATSTDFPVTSVGWDLNGDGVFDVFGALASSSTTGGTTTDTYTASVPWSQLVALGLTNDNGGNAYPVTVAATNDEGTSDSQAGLTIAYTPPVVTVTGAATAQVGVPYTIGFSKSQFGSEPIVGWQINWGDGSPLQPYGSTATSATHSYAQPTSGAVTIQVQALIGGESNNPPATGTRSVTAVTVPPSISQFTVPTQGVQGTPVTVSAVTSDPAPFDTFTYAWTVTQNGQTITTSSLPSFSFVPLVPGTYNVSFNVSDSYQGAAEASQNVTVVDAPPVILQASAVGTVQDGTPATISVVASDPGGSSDPLTYAFGFTAPGTYEVPATSNSSTNWTFATPGPHTVYVQVTDSHGESTTTSFTVNVTAAVPVAPISGPATGMQGQAYVLTLGPVTDPATSVVNSWTINWGDGETDVVAGSLTTASHVYTSAGDFTISASVTNPDGSFAAANTVPASIAVAPPVLTIAGPTNVNEGIYTLNLSAFTYDHHTMTNWTINWGDGTPEQTVAGYLTTATHLLSGPASDTITATANDSLGTYTANSLTVNVANVAPTIVGVATVEPYAQEGTPATLKVDASDPGGEALTYAFDFNNDGIYDATSTTGEIVNTFANAGVYPIGIQVSNGAGGTATTTYMLNVQAVIPTLSVTSTPANATVNVGAPLQLHLSFNALPNHPVLSYSVAWGDGTVSNYTVATDGLNPSHVYSNGDLTNVVAVTNVTTNERNFGTLGSVTATVNDVPPTIALSGAPLAVDTLPYTLTLGAVSDPGPVTISGYTVNWGDGQSDTYTVAPTIGQTLTHTYAVGFTGNATITLTLVDQDGPQSAGQLTVQVVADPPPVANAGGPYTVPEGGSVQLNALGSTDLAQLAASLSYAWDFHGNGQFIDATGPTPTFSAANLEGPSTVTVYVRVTNALGETNVGSAVITVSRVLPTATITGAPASSLEGTAIPLTASATNPSLAEMAAGFSYAWTVTQTRGNVTVNYASGAGSAFTLTPNDDGVYIVTLSATDQGGGVGTTSQTVTVTNVAPTATLVAPTTVNEGSSFSVDLTNAYDPSSVDTAAGFHYAFAVDGASLASATYANSAASATQNFAFYSGPTNHTITERIFDKDNGYTDYTAAIHVNDIAPTVVAAPGQAVVPGVPTAFLLGTFSDPGTADNPWAVDVNWGDGSPHTDFTTSLEGILPPQAHTYATTGAFTVTIKVTDNGGLSGQATMQVTSATSLYVLASTASGALQLSGNASLNVPGNVFVASSNSQAVSLSGNAQLSAGSLLVHGGIQTSGNVGIHGAVATGVAVSNPLASLAYSPATTNPQSAVNVSGNNTATINPGTYVGINVSGNAVLNMNPGVYVLMGGGFNVSGNAVVNGAGVALVNTGSSSVGYGAFNVSGNGKLYLTPPPAAAGQVLVGIVLYQPAADTDAINISGNAIVGSTGTIYAPTAHVNLSGNGNFRFSIIANEVALSGNAIETGPDSTSGNAGSEQANSTVNTAVSNYVQWNTQLVNALQSLTSGSGSQEQPAVSVAAMPLVFTVSDQTLWADWEALFNDAQLGTLLVGLVSSTGG